MPQPSDQFGAKPDVLRCARCGKFVDWEHAYVQIVCTCRPRIELPPVLVREATDADRGAVRELFERGFGRTQLVAFGEVMDIDQMPALVAVVTRDPAGALAYRLLGNALHIVALATDPMWQRSGVGAYLLAEAELIARRLSLPRIVVATTNDNLPALYFYQRRGYRLLELVPDNVVAHTGRDVAGFAGIPVRDEIRLEKRMIDR
ncbi:MAG TPA: GNAT family N-acetyltransferase [Vicinamibacterales bacterium]|nr:GNAT family N-acetyltransferase [Vicinamibacterales bacterium]